MHVSDKQGVGFLTYALNTDVDYERCAVLWALSVRATQKQPVQIAVVVNNKHTCRSDLHDVCDHVITCPQRPVVNNMQYEADLLKLSPFKETIKMECDMLIPCDMSVWMHTFRQRDLLITGRVIDHKYKTADDTRYRQFIRVNQLPNAYNGLYYVRVTQQTVKFFKEFDRIFAQWDHEIRRYRLWERHEPSTDFAMSMALANLGMDNCVSATNMPTFVHNKRYCVGAWQYHAIPNPHTIIINGARIQYPWHYHDKSLATDQLISKYKKHV